MRIVDRLTDGLVGLHHVTQSLTKAIRFVTYAWLDKDGSRSAMCVRAYVWPCNRRFYQANAL